MQPLRMGTRGSPLALWQAEHVKGLLGPGLSGRGCELVIIQTTGDQVKDAPLQQIGGEGLFTREIQNALIGNHIDAAVHSLKDLPTIPHDQLCLGAVPARGPRHDVLVSNRYKNVADLPRHARIGTGSPRRRAMLLAKRPDLIVVALRGNVQTRLRKLHDEDLDGILLAEAGLMRLGLQDAITERLDSAWMVPAVGQGALGIECRREDHGTRELLHTIQDECTFVHIQGERSFLRHMGGGCQLPVGVWSEGNGELGTLRALACSADGGQVIDMHVEGEWRQAEEMGRRLCELMIDQGAKELLAGF